MHPRPSEPLCPFCRLDAKPIAQNSLAFAIRDKYPVTPGHTLVIPKRHVADYFELTKEEHDAIRELVRDQKLRLEAMDPAVSGFNLGVNVGQDAGQTIFHVHVHLIPRRHGDMEKPQGGVRGVIPEKRRYGK